MNNERHFEFIDDISTEHEISDTLLEVTGAQYVTAFREHALVIPAEVRSINTLDATYRAMDIWAGRVWRQEDEHHRNLWVMTPTFFAESEFHPFWRRLERSPRLAGVFVQGTESEIDLGRAMEQERIERANMTPDQIRAHDEELVASMERFEQFRLQTFMAEAVRYEVGSMRHYLAMEALRTLASQGNEEAIRLIERLGH